MEPPGPRPGPEGRLVTRRFAALAVLVLGVAGGPPAARAPSLPAPGGDWFAREALLEALAAAPDLSPFSEPAPPPPSRPPASAVPEPAAAVLTALGLAAFALARRRRDAAQ